MHGVYEKLFLPPKVKEHRASVNGKGCVHGVLPRDTRVYFYNKGREESIRHAIWSMYM